MPVVSACLALIPVHALLDDGPFAVIGDEKAVEIKIESVLHGRAIDLGNQSAGARQWSCVESLALAKPGEFVRRSARVFTAPAADMDSKLVLQGASVHA